MTIRANPEPHTFIPYANGRPSCVRCGRLRDHPIHDSLSDSTASRSPHEREEADR